jgi:hypothetical protein
VIDALGDGRKDADGRIIPPLAFSMASVMAKATFLAARNLDGTLDRNSFAAWLGDRKNRPRIPHRFETCGFSPERNPDADSGLLNINSTRQMVYARADLSARDRAVAARWVADTGGEVAVDPRPSRRPSAVSAVIAVFYLIIIFTSKI